MRLSSAFNMLMAGSAISGVACGLLAIGVPYFAFNAAFLVGGSFTVMGLSLAATACATVRENGRLTMLMTSGIAAAVIAMVVWLLMIRLGAGWPQSTVEPIVLLAGSVTIWAGWCMIIAVVCGRRALGWISGITRILAVLCVSVLAIAIEIVLVNPKYADEHEEFFGRSIVAMVILTLATVLSAMIASRWRQLGSAASTAEEEQIRLPMRVWCPRCGLEQQFTTGGAMCSSCGLSIKVVVP
jgi:hypothetical protein